MALNFRRVLIGELERKLREVETMLELLRGLQRPETNTPAAQPAPIPPQASGPRKPPCMAARRNAREIHEQVLALRKQGLSLRAIANETCLSHAGVWKVLRRSGKS